MSKYQLIFLTMCISLLAVACTKEEPKIKQAVAVNTVATPPTPDPNVLRSSQDIERRVETKKAPEFIERTVVQQPSQTTQTTRRVDPLEQDIEQLQKTPEGRILLRKLLAAQRGRDDAPKDQDDEKAKTTSKTKIVVVENNSTESTTRQPMPEYKPGENVSLNDITVSPDRSPDSVKQGAPQNVFGLNGFGLPSTPVYANPNNPSNTVGPSVNSNNTARQGQAYEGGLLTPRTTQTPRFP